MNKSIALLTDFGFTKKDAQKIAKRAHENRLTLADIQAWINEAMSSRSLHNPMGFVRARLQDGDKLRSPQVTDPHRAHRQYYKTQFNHLHPNQADTQPDLTQICTCGRAVWKDRICKDCGLCPKCCQCSPENIDKE